MADLPALLDVAEPRRRDLRGRGPFDPVLRPDGRWRGGTLRRARALACNTERCRRAFSCGGGFAAAPTDLIEYLRFYSDTASCALPPSVVAAASAVIDVIQAETWRRAAAGERGLFQDAPAVPRHQHGHLTSYVVPIVVGEDRALLYELGHQLRAHGLFLTPVDYPTVPLDQARFRASVTALHTREVLDEALQILEDLFIRRCGRGACSTRTI